MKIKVWLEYFIYMAAIILLLSFLPPVERVIFSIIPPEPRVQLMINTMYITIGIILGLEYFIPLLKKKVKWGINLPKLLLMGIPALYFCTCYFFMWNFEIRDTAFLQPVFKFIVHGEMFISIFQLMLGYSIITSFYKKDGEAKSTRPKSWLRYLVYSIIILVVQYSGGAMFTSTGFAGKVHLNNIIMILLYAGLGLMLGTEYLSDETKKEGVWKINLPKILFMGIPSLYFSLYSFFIGAYNQYNQSTAAYPFRVLYNSFIGDYFVPVFQFILGYSIITSLYKRGDAASARSLINGVVTPVENIINKLGCFIERHSKTITASMVCVVIILSILINMMSNKKLEDITGVNFDSITSIGLQYDSVKFPAVTVRDPEKVKEFTDLLRKSAVRKKLFQYDYAGYYLMAAFYSNENRVLNILFMGDFITIWEPGTDKQVEYGFVRGSISPEKLDEFVQSVE